MTRKTTVYLPDDLKRAIEGTAQRRGTSEAEVIREALEKSLSAPRPNFGILDGEPFAGDTEALLDGFGER